MSRKEPNPYPPKDVVKPPPPPPPPPKRVIYQDVQLGKGIAAFFRVFKKALWIIIPFFVGLKIGFLTWPHLSDEQKDMVGQVHDYIATTLNLM